MEALPPFFGYQIFAALVPMSSACNSGDVMTLLLQYWLVLSGDPFSLLLLSFCWSTTSLPFGDGWSPANGLQIVN